MIARYKPWNAGADSVITMAAGEMLETGLIKLLENRTWGTLQLIDDNVAERDDAVDRASAMFRI